MEITKLSVKFTPCALSYDFKEVNSYVDELKKRYKNLVVTEDQVKEMKKVATELNKVKTKINDEKKRIKKEATQDVLIFEKEAVEIVNDIDSLRKGITSQCNGFLEKQKQERKEEIKNYYESLENDCGVPFDAVFNDEMLRESDKKIKENLSLNVKLVNEEYNRLNNFDVENIELLQDEFKKVWNTSIALGNYHVELAKIKKYTEPKEEPKQELEVKDEKMVNVMTLIRGKESAWVKAKEYMESIGLIVEEI